MSDCLVCAFDPCDLDIHTAVSNIHAWLRDDVRLTLSFHEKFARELAIIKKKGRHHRMSQGIDIVGQGMNREEVLDKVLCDLFDYIDHEELIVNPNLTDDEVSYIEDSIDQARAYYEQGL